LPQSQSWDPDRYARNARFVADLGMPVVELLKPEPGEYILDLGCGDGALTEKLADMGCTVVGVDGSEEQIKAARGRGLDAHTMDGHHLTYEPTFDAVFSNAALHWMKRPDEVIAGVWDALKPGGRFVAECGGHGCVNTIVTALLEGLQRRGIQDSEINPWYFATDDEYGKRLEKQGFVMHYIALIPRPTPLPGDIIGWLETFAESFTSCLPEAERGGFLAEVRATLVPKLCDENGRWTADYIRLRFAAEKPQRP